MLLEGAQTPRHIRWISDLELVWVLRKEGKEERQEGREGGELRLII